MNTFLETSAANEGDALDVSANGFLAAQVTGTATTAVIGFQCRLHDGEFVTLTDDEDAEVTITGTGVLRRIDVRGVDEVRPYVKTIEASKNVTVLMRGYGNDA